MNLTLEPKGFPVAADDAHGLCARLRKGKVSIYFRTNENKSYDIDGNETTLSGQVFELRIKKDDKENEKAKRNSKPRISPYQRSGDLRDVPE